MKTAVIYSRVSTQEQSFQSQIDDLNKYANVHNIKVIEVFSEKVSGYSKKAIRTEYDAMKEYVEANSIKLILCWELSRFGRNALNTQNEIEYYKNKGVDIFFKKENINTLSEEPSAKLLLTLLASLAEMERSMIISRGVRGRTTSAEQGKRVGFPIMPYGFEADEKGYIKINEAESKIVNLMYELYSKGVGSGEICNKLNSEEIKTRNSLRGRKRISKKGEHIEIVWRQNTVRKILKSPLYKGERNYKGSLTIKIPQIVSVELWDKVQENFKKHIGHINATKYEYLFKSKVYCGECGLIYNTESRQTKTSLSSFYTCSGRKDKGIKCKNGQIRANFLDEKVYDLLFRHRDIMLKVYKENAKTFKVEEKKEQIQYYLGLIEKENKRSRASINLYKNDEISEDEFNSDIRKIKNNVLAHEASIKSIQKEIDAYTDISVASTLTSLLTETDFNIKREFILKYVDKLNIYKVNRTDIDFTKLSHTDLKTMKEVKLKNPISNDKLSYVEIFAFGNAHPLRLVLSSYTDICYTNDKLTYILGHLSLLK